MSKPTNVRPTATALYLHPIRTRVPLKFGPEVLTDVQLAHVELDVRDARGRRARGFGETPLSVQWAWPSDKPYAERLQAMVDFSKTLARAWAEFDCTGHPLEIGHAFLRDALPALPRGEVPHLAALICCSAFDIALHDAYGKLHEVDSYETYNEQWLNRDLAHYFASDRFRQVYPDKFLLSPPRQLPVWHLVGGLDPLDPGELTGQEPNDGYPVLLRDWIRRDGLRCLKIKLRGTDPAWDYERIGRVGQIALESGIEALSTDFNCTVQDPAVVITALERLAREHPKIYDLILYVEQPFPYDLEKHPYPVHALAALKPLFMDESAHDWKLVQLGHSLGWNGVALKTCKTQTGALLSLCWAKAHGMKLMVQDLTNPMLAMIPHVRLAAHAGTIKGVEANAMQFYPVASAAEERLHPGLYQRRNGVLDLSTLRGPGFGYRADEIQRAWSNPIADFGF